MHLLINVAQYHSISTKVDNVIVCAGQHPNRELEESVRALGKPLHIIGGAFKAAELDAKEAINQGARLAATV